MAKDKTCSQYFIYCTIYILHISDDVMAEEVVEEVVKEAAVPLQKGVIEYSIVIPSEDENDKDKDEIITEGD